MKIKDIQITFFVRASLNQGRVQFFHDRRKAGEDLEKVIVDRDTKELIDGRHRIAAAEKFGDTDIGVEFRQYASQEERVAAALAANAGGSLPPNNEDIYHTIGYLFGLRVSRKRVTEMVAASLGVTEAFVKNSVSWVLTKLRMISITKAADAVVRGEETVVTAAEKFGIRAEEVQAELGGTRKKSKRNDVGLQLTNLLKGASRSVGGQLNVVQNAVAEGEMKLDEARAIVDQVQKQLKNMIKHNANWLKRFTQAEAMPKAAARLGSQRAKKNRSLAKKTGGGTASTALKAMGL